MNLFCVVTLCVVTAGDLAAITSDLAVRVVYGPLAAVACHLIYAG